ncbi:MAG: CXXX repeat peptide maturase [Candidatus Azobacteroides sp.]|nr:CXXX repeat peptide maturase [Candidatus Azobacteroides sp.]
MLQYLIILLDDTSVSYCHYENKKTARKLISIPDLEAGILFAMKENLMIQFVYPQYDLPKEYLFVIETIDHNKIMPYSGTDENADVIVLDGWDNFPKKTDIPIILRTEKNDFFSNYKELIPLLKEVKRLNIVITNIETFKENDFTNYESALSELKNAVNEQYVNGVFPQLNILSDRIMLDKMNNCNAGVENITLAPNGKFYICPAFYLEDENDSIGDLCAGMDIKNKQLYKISYAPICRVCDAYQCKRCVWLSRKTTLEVNTPSHEQCVVSHIERNVSRELLTKLQSAEIFKDKNEIKAIDYLDPFDVATKNL